MNNPNQALVEQIRFYLDSGDRVAEALLLIRNTEKILEAAKEKVKARAREIMDKEGTNEFRWSTTDPDTGEVKEWQVKKMEATEIRKYDPATVMYELPQELAAQLLEVKTSELKKLLPQWHIAKKISDTQLEKIGKAYTTATRKGSVQLREIIPKI